MKISDVTLTLFAWPGIPPTTYGRHTGRFGGESQLGLLTLTTDEGVVGHAFLGSALRGAHLDAVSLIEVLKPVVLGQDPLDRERLYHALWQRSRQTTARAIGAVDVALWDLAGKIAGLPVHRLLGSYRDRVRAYASSAVLGSPEAYGEEAARFKAEGWTGYKIHPPTEPATRHPGLPRRAPRGRRRLHGDARRELGLRLPDRAEGRRGDRGARLPLVRGSARRRRPLQLRQAQAAPAHPHPRHRVLARAASPPTPRGSWRGRRTSSGATSRSKAGSRRCVKAAHLAEAFHMNYEVHHGGNSLNNVANLHVIMAIRNCEFFEVLLPAGAQKYGLIEDVEVDGQGLVHAPKGPGSGPGSTST